MKKYIYLCFLLNIISVQISVNAQTICSNGDHLNAGADICIQQGQSVTLTPLYVPTGACVVWTQPSGIGLDFLLGSLNVSPDFTTTYTIIATGGGFEYKCKDDVKVFVINPESNFSLEFDLKRFIQLIKKIPEELPSGLCHGSLPESIDTASFSISISRICCDNKPKVVYGADINVSTGANFECTGPLPWLGGVVYGYGQIGVTASFGLSGSTTCDVPKICGGGSITGSVQIGIQSNPFIKNILFAQGYIQGSISTTVKTCIWPITFEDETCKNIDGVVSIRWIGGVKVEGKYNFYHSCTPN